MEAGAGNAPTPPGDSEHPGRWARLRHQWGKRLEPGQQATVLAWVSFTLTFVGLRTLTHWIRAGHGPAGGGVKVGGKHFHHYNIGIALFGDGGSRGPARNREATAPPRGRGRIRFGERSDR
jgi:hypothetical protein